MERSDRCRLTVERVVERVDWTGMSARSAAGTNDESIALKGID